MATQGWEEQQRVGCVDQWVLSFSQVREINFVLLHRRVTIVIGNNNVFYNSKKQEQRIMIISFAAKK